MKLLLKHKADPTQRGWVRIQDKLKQVSPLELANHYLHLREQVPILKLNFPTTLTLKARSFCNLLLVGQRKSDIVYTSYLNTRDILITIRY